MREVVLKGRKGTHEKRDTENERFFFLYIFVYCPSYKASFLVLGGKIERKDDQTDWDKITVMFHRQYSFSSLDVEIIDQFSSSIESNL